MAFKLISELTAAVSVADTDLIEIETAAGASRKAVVGLISGTPVVASLSALGALSIAAFSAGKQVQVRTGSGATVEVRQFSLEAGTFTENTDPTAGRVIVNVDSNPTGYSWFHVL